MNLEDVFIPVNVRDELNIENISNDSWINAVEIYDRTFPSLSGKKIALIGLIGNKSDYDCHEVRNQLYALMKKEYAMMVADLGNFYLDLNDPKIFEKLGYILSEIQSMGIIPLVIGSNSPFVYSQYLAFEYLTKYVTYCCINSKIDLFFNEDQEAVSDNYLSKILLREPSYLFHLIHLGVQSFLTDQMAFKMMEKFYFDVMRLGRIRESFDDIEPFIRNADFISFSLSSVRQADAMASYDSSAAGFTVEEAVKIARFAGISDNLQSFSIYGYRNEIDNNHQTAKLIAQMIWYFTDGVAHRFNEVKIGDEINFVKYIAADVAGSQPITFYKSRKTNRWWMEIPLADPHHAGKEIIPCSYKDYEMASKGEIPDRYWLAFKKSI
ncbi:MAG: hypothetical protein GX437_00355 [Sphingobacteriales bacterium]|nr:hypothetical protein [Sphingobacteriales bacterium]